MPTIDMSAGFAANVPARICNLTEASSGFNTVVLGGLLQGSSNAFTGYGGSGAVALIFLMQGTPPLAPTLANINSRASDILVRYQSNTNNGGGDFVTSQTNVNPVTVSTQYVAASASGTATWFWWVVAPGIGPSPYYSTSAALLQQIIGTVGATGSGADLEVPSTTVTAGEQYRLLNLRLQIPTSWTY